MQDDIRGQDKRDMDAWYKKHYKGESDKKEVRKAQGKGLVFQRYCHVYKKGELEGLAARLGKGVSVVESYYDTGNWCMVLEKGGDDAL